MAHNGNGVSNEPKQRITSRWYVIGAVAVCPTPHRMIIADAADLPVITLMKWHVRTGKHPYARAWLDSRRASAQRGKAIYLHDYLMLKTEGMCIDFVNGNTLDCRRENLRIADKSEDRCNLKATHSNTGHLGVHYSNERGKYVAQIKFRGKWKYLGRHDTLQKAIEVRDRAARELHGEFASIGITSEIQG